MRFAAKSLVLLLVPSFLLACEARYTAGGTATGTPGQGSPTPTSSGSPLPSNCGTASVSGGQLSCLSFAIVGDTRPADEGDTSAYPTSIITQIFQDIQTKGASFVTGTGDYQYADPTTTDGTAQINLYMTARAGFSGPFFPAMGNHECDGYTADNCDDSGNITTGGSGSSNNFKQFMSQMLTPLSQTLPYYSVNFSGPNNSWTAKFVFVAGNAWDSTQSAWLTSTLAKPTTYTFVFRHEASDANTAPGVTPSDPIIKAAAVTLFIVGHSHELKYSTGGDDANELVNGIGGAPLDSGDNYGYVMGVQRPSDGAMVFDAYDYQSGADIMHFVVTAAGAPTT